MESTLVLSLHGDINRHKLLLSSVLILYDRFETTFIRTNEGVPRAQEEDPAENSGHIPSKESD